VTFCLIRTTSTAFAALVLGACVSIGRNAGKAEAGAAEPVTGGRADLHVHLVMHAALPHFQGDVDGPILATSPDQFWVNQLTTDGLRRSGISLVIAACWPPFALRPGRTAMDETLGQAAALAAFLRTHPGFAAARTVDGARRLMARDLIAVLPHVEGAEAVQSVADVDVLYAAGFRVIGLVHFTDNALADAHDGQFGSILAPILNGRDGGLTPLGRQAVRRMIQLGMLIDLGHTSARTREDVLAITESSGVPVMYSHEGADWYAPRTLGEEHARRIAAGGGLIGVGVYRHDALMPLPASDRLSPHALTTCDDAVAMWRVYERLVGASAMALGSDLNSAILRPRPGGRCPNGIRHAGDLPALFDALAKEGVSAAAWNGTAEKVLRVLERVEAVADPAERARALRTPVRERGHFDAPL
jgi:membrane dipeptidase